MIDGDLFSIKVGDEGEPVMFLHGLFGQARNFNGIAKGLRPAYRSLLVDLPNHGRSPWTTGFAYEDMADLVADHLREVLNDQPVNLVGHSMGGKVAMVLALRHPGLVRRLVVGDISPADSSTVSDFDKLLGALKSVDLYRIKRRGDADDALREKIRNPAVRGFLLQNLYQDDGTWAWRANLEMLHDELGAVGGFPDFVDESFAGPVLWVAGSESDYIQADHHEYMRELFPRTVLVTLKGAGHWIHSEKPDEFLSVLRSFFAAD